MNLTKKLFSYIVAIAMIFTLTAFAGGAVNAADAKTYTLKLTGTTTGHTYEAYQIFTGDLSKGVLSNVKWGEGVAYTGEETSAADVAKALDENNKNKMTIDQLLEKLKLTQPVKTVTSAEGSTVIDGLAAGYYLVKDEDGSQKDTQDAYTKFIVQVVGDTEAAIKSGVPTVTKKVKDINDSEESSDKNPTGWQDSADYDIDDYVPYQITGTMPANINDYTTYKYEFTDNMSQGLTYVNDKDHKTTIKIGDTDVTESFKEVKTENTDGTTTVTWTCNNLKNKEDKEDNKLKDITLTEYSTVVVTYFAKLNEHAVIGSEGNPNTVNLTYSRNPNKGGEGDTGKTPDDTNIVFTYKTVVNKVDQDGKTPLKGAAFKLEKKKADNTYKTVKEFTAGDATTFEFTGLDDGYYRLTETTTPAGYNTITPVEFTISAKHDVESADPKLTELTVSVTKGSDEATFEADKIAGEDDKIAGSLTTKVVNKKGSVLPETGGMGTTLLYVLGGVLVALAAAYVIYTKKHEKA